MVVGGGCGGEREGGGGGVPSSHTLHVLLEQVREKGRESEGEREREGERKGRMKGRKRRREGQREGAMNCSECTAPSGYAPGGLQGACCHRVRGGPEGWSRGRSGTAAAAAAGRTA